jgi:Cft2 family RNA processing exonuclease
MAAEVVKSQLIAALGREVITILDDYGTEFQLQVPVTVDAATRQSRIDAAVAQQSANEARLVAYSKTHDLDLSAQFAAGQAKKKNYQETA